MSSPKNNGAGPAEPIDSRPVVLSIAFPFAPIGPSAVGGAEVVLSQLEAALPALGFRSVVVAHAASKPCGRLYPTRVPQREISDSVRAEVERTQQANIDRALAENPVALVHMHGLDFHRYRIPPHIPVVVTLHLPPSWYPETIWNVAPNYRLVCVSQSERRACPPDAWDRVSVVENGVPLPDASVLRPQGHYALILSRICPEKNIHAALDAARLAGMPVILAGETFPYESHQNYFTQQIQPRLSATGQNHENRQNGDSHAAEARFVGPVTGAAKTRLLARAACLLLPSLAPETSSLVAMEALAAGTPVIAVASSAVPEIVAHGHTGLLIEPGNGIVPEMAEAISQISKIHRSDCRAAAEQRFPLARMLDGYKQLYGHCLLYATQTRCAFSGSSSHPLGLHRANRRIRIEHLSHAHALEATIEPWLQLWARDTCATPFQHPAWLLPWWRQFGPDGDLHALLLRDETLRDQDLPDQDSSLLGLLPFYVYHQPPRGQKPADRQLIIIGGGTTDILDGIYDRSADPVQVAAAGLRFVLELRCWDSLSLMQLRANSPLLAAAKVSDLSIFFSHAAADPCSILDLSRDMPPKLASNARRYRRRAETNGPLSFTVAETPDEALTFFEELTRLHAERWQSRGESGVLADARVVAHHREAIPGLIEAGLLRLIRLALNGEGLGLLYALADPPERMHRTLYLYLVGINMQFADLSPGTLLYQHVWEYARQEGFDRLNLLRGGEDYKQLWGAEADLTFALHASAAQTSDEPAAFSAEANLVQESAER